MKTNQTEKVELKRKLYVKPRIERVRLVLDEAVLSSGCKMAGMGGPQNPCQESPGANNCLNDGT